MKWIQGLSVVVVAGLLASGCTPKEKEKIIIQERQAPANLSESLQISSDDSQLVLQKSALGKAFLLTPSLVISKRTPDFNDFKPQIVSFERSGSRLGLFRLSNNNLYDTIPTDKLMQSFRIVKETSETMTIDISQGFKNLPLEEHLSIVEKSAVEASATGSEGLETTMDIKEALIRKTEVSGNVMYIEQAVRIANLSKVAEDTETATNNDPVKIEMTAKVIIEIKPYLQNKKFKAQLFDKEQRVGYFINFTFMPEEEQVLPQITKWDLSEESGVITVALEENIPQEIQAATEEGITYWNRVVGREVLKVRHGFKATDRVSDRMIVVRWVKWESAGFAYASMQADPSTGEILRAQIFMTSSWLKAPKKATKFPVAQKSGLCVLEQSKMNTTKSYMNLTDARKETMAQDVIRTVVAHEMGHVMGLRHNFSGSLKHEGDDQGLLKAQTEYLNNDKHEGFTFSSTVMDYEGILHTAMLGANIKHATLPYDRAAIGWGYKDEKIELAANSYCSDEHISLANNQGADIYGCERFDAFKNPALGSAYEVKSSFDNIVTSTFNNAVEIKMQNDPYSENRSFVDASRIYLSVSLEKLENVLFVEKDKLNLLSAAAVIANFKSSLSAESTVMYDGNIAAQLKDDLTAIGGVTGLLNLFLDLEKNNPEDLHLLENQAQDFFKTLNASSTGFTEVELAQVVMAMNESAKENDKTLFAKVMSKFVPVYKGNYRYKTMKEYKDAQKNPEKYPAPVMRYRDSVVLGDVKLLMSLFKKAILSGKSEPKKVIINGQELQVQVLGSNYERENLLKAFVLENWPSSKQYEIREALTEQLAQLKTEVTANSVAILKALGQPLPEPLTYAELVKALNAIPYSQMSGIYAYELIYNDLAVLDKIEKVKAE